MDLSCIAPERVATRSRSSSPRLRGETEKVTSADLPQAACWQHQGLRSGFEVAYFTVAPGRVRVDGTTTGLQDGLAWIVGYRLELDGAWATRRARVIARGASGRIERVLEADGVGHWLVDGEARPELDGCWDIDLESSAMTNALPIHRLGLSIGTQAAAPAAYVRIFNLTVERIEQSYARTDDQAGSQRYDYEAAAFDFRCRLAYDKSGLVVDYPGIAVRAG
jgi:hypothetical protein